MTNPTSIIAFLLLGIAAIVGEPAAFLVLVSVVLLLLQIIKGSS
jgi:ABC-type phosphate transport system permease subunit